MKNWLLTVEIIFFNIAEKDFNFPIKNSIRTSFWLIGGNKSIFSEVQVEQPIEKWEFYTLTIIVPQVDYIQVKVDTEFKIGTFPHEIAYGRIIGIEIL